MKVLMMGYRPKNESFEERERRQFALSVLDSPEQLMMYAQSTNDVSHPLSTISFYHEDENREKKGGRKES